MKNKVVTHSWRVIAFFIIILLTEFISRSPTRKTLIFKPGEVSDRTILAPVEFRVFKSPDSLRAESLYVRDTVTPVLSRVDVTEITQARLDTFISLLNSISEFVPDTILDSVNPPQITENYFIDSLYQWLEPRDITLVELESISSQLTSKDVTNFQKALSELLDTIESAGYSESYAQNKQKTVFIVDLENLNDLNEQNIYFQGSILFNIDQLNDAVLTYAAFRKEDTLLMRNALRRIAEKNLQFNREWTKSRIDSAIRAIDPYTDQKISKGAEIIRQHQQITVEDSIKISSLITYLGPENPITINLFGKSRIQIKQIIGRILLMIIIVILTLIFIQILTPRTWHSTSKMWLIILISFIVMISSSILIKYIFPSDAEMFLEFPTGNFKYDAIIIAPVALAGMLLVLLVGIKEALILSTMLAMAVGIYWNFSYQVFLVLMTGSLSLIAVSRTIHRRSNFYSGLIAMFLSMSLVSLALYLFTFEPVKLFFITILLILISSTISVFFSLGLIPILERIFNSVTDMKLLELAQDTQPLIYNMARIAQGTKFHSLIVGDIAEAAARKIGANPILTRVGAYYHDIGKIENPDGFIENQGFNGKNIHDSISPKESVNILRKHVTDGVKLAKQHKLPSEIIEFIKTHHGTTFMEIFYHKAKDLENQGGPPINEQEYRYPGPLPKTKEAGLIMLADGIEAACRSLKNPTEEDIKDKVHSIIQKRLTEGQLNLTNLSLRDISIIEQVYTKHLIGLYHPRVPYPSDKDQNGKDSPNP
ncbi:MAG: hypothetical protein APR63_08380 [Desulfuromonas sp. SDB]|nr:MAG: hypothetical protein APR63_08380 [Desulfuromonas sp. SDB]